MARLDARLELDNPVHKAYVDKVELVRTHYESESLDVWEKALDWWDLFLAIQEDTRDPVDEDWRSQVFVPMPFSTTRTKAAAMTDLLTNAEPVWQVEATREGTNFFEMSKNGERLIDYSLRMNAWRKFFYKLMIARSVQGTAFFKIVNTRRAHVVTLNPSPDEYSRFTKAIGDAQMTGAPPAPNWMADPAGFEGWRKLVNTAERFGYIPAPPESGPKNVVEYEGPLFQYIPIWSIYLDPTIDEIANQRFIIHRMVKPYSYVEERMDDKPWSPDAPANKPFLKRNVEHAMQGWDGQILQNQQNQLYEKLGLNPMKESDPVYEKAVELEEVWSPAEPFQYSIVMNKSAVINKLPFERPLLTSSPNVFALRNIIIPGAFYGLSDYQEPEQLFKELNEFRRLRMDRAKLTTIGVYVKQAGVVLTNEMRKLRPGAVITAPTANAITSLIRDNMPPEAYREPPEMKAEIADATEVYDSTKGAPAQVGRVTGTEFQGRQQGTTLKFKVDGSLVEDEMLMVPPVMLSFFAQMRGDVRQEIGGDPDMLVDLKRSDLIQLISARFRFRGATKNIQPDLQVQQLTTVLREFQQDLQPAERRFLMQLMLEMLDVRGYSKVVTPEGTQAATQLGAQQTGVAGAQANAAQDAVAAQNVPGPGAMPVDQAAQAVGGGGAPAAPPQQ